MTKRFKGAWQWVLGASLWIVSAGLMLASSGLDGAYLSKLMPAGWGFLGLVLNTMTDIASEVGMYWYGRIQQDRSKAKRKRARWVLVGQVLLVGYAWLFSWRQLVPIMRQVDPEAANAMSMLAAGFIPLALVVVGYVQSLLAGRIDEEKDDKPAETQQPVVIEPVNVAQDVPSEPPMVTTEERRKRVLAAYLSDDTPTQAELAEQFGVSRSAIGNDVKELRRIGSLNGQGRH